jgi:hypothetical protein
MTFDPEEWCFHTEAARQRCADFGVEIVQYLDDLEAQPHRHEEYALLAEAWFDAYCLATQQDADAAWVERAAQHPPLI